VTDNPLKNNLIPYQSLKTCITYGKAMHTIWTN